ncbi:MAG: class I SAM-dependent methyltransferase [Alphaproteobacteria bacterium]
MNNSGEEEAARFVTLLYRGILRREPDAEEQAGHVRALLSGASYSSIAESFVSSQEFRSVPQATGLFVAPGHYYSPIVDPVAAEKYLKTIDHSVTNLPGINIDRPKMVSLWHELLPFLTTAPFPDQKSDAFHYFFDNPSYSWGDGSVLHAMLRYFKPKRLIEIGSGYSSVCSFDTVERYLDSRAQLTFVEPYAGLLKAVLGEAAARVQIIEKPVQEVPLELFQELEAGDVLFIDSTHVLRTGSDVCFELLEVLPRLARGVIVHFHDMFWPFEYPSEWVVKENRSWNELYAVRAFLINNSNWNILFFNNYLAWLEQDMIERTFPAFLRNSGGALWLQRA